MSSPSIFSLCLEFQSETCGITVENLSIIFVVLLCGSSPSLSMISSLPSPSLIHSYPTFKLLWVPRAMFRSPSCGSSSMTSSFPSPSLIHSLEENNLNTVTLHTFNYTILCSGLPEHSTPLPRRHCFVSLSHPPPKPYVF